MPRESIQMTARVVESLPNALYKLELDNAATVTAHLSGSAGILRVLPGETVVVELMPYDRSRGRIVSRRA